VEFNCDQVITAWAECIYHPYDDDKIVRVLVKRTDGKLDLDYLKPGEQSEVMLLLGPYSELVSRNMACYTHRLFNEKRGSGRKGGNVKLNAGDYIVTAWAEFAVGPGWSNRIVWVLIREVGGKLRLECLQPGEQSKDIIKLSPYSALVTEDITKSVKELLSKKRTQDS
jgi:hypothetical protein